MAVLLKVSAPVLSLEEHQVTTPTVTELLIVGLKIVPTVLSTKTVLVLLITSCTTTTSLLTTLLLLIQVTKQVMDLLLVTGTKLLREQRMMLLWPLHKETVSISLEITILNKLNKCPWHYGYSVMPRV